MFGVGTLVQTGATFTDEDYYGAWITSQFCCAVVNAFIVTVFVPIISLSFGTLGGYALARIGRRHKFWVLNAALILRAMPAITLEFRITFGKRIAHNNSAKPALLVL